MTIALGAKCVRCGVENCLTFDCIKPTGDRHHRMSSVQRVSYYRHQMRMGNIQLLCHSCNAKKGAMEQPALIPTCAPADVFPR